MGTDWRISFPSLARDYPKWLADNPGMVILGAETPMPGFVPSSPTPTLLPPAPKYHMSTPETQVTPWKSDNSASKAHIPVTKTQVPLPKARVSFGPKVAPDGYIINIHRKIAKKKPPYKERTEYGNHFIAVTRGEMTYLRPSFSTQPNKVFVNDPNRHQAKIWITNREVARLNTYRKHHGGRQVKISEKKLNDHDFQEDTDRADCRYEDIENMKQQGISFRTKDARFHLSFVDGLDGLDGLL